MNQPRRATTADLDTTVELLVSAFYRDPTWAWVFPDDTLRRAQHRRLWSIYVRGALRFDQVWLAAGDTATSIWIPPGESELSESEEAELERAMAEMLGRDLHRILATFELLQQAHPHEPHFYLSLLGTGEQFRGHGYGLNLLADNLAFIDQTHMPAYLEASNEVNVALYARYGFEVRDVLRPAPDGPVVTTMWRNAR